MCYAWLNCAIRSSVVLKVFGLNVFFKDQDLTTVCLITQHMILV